MFQKIVFEKFVTRLSKHLIKVVIIYSRIPCNPILHLKSINMLTWSPYGQIIDTVPLLAPHGKSLPMWAPSENLSIENAL